MSANEIVFKTKKKTIAIQC